MPGFFSQQFIHPFKEAKIIIKNLEESDSKLRFLKQNQYN
jgi:hypothetical protein